MAPDTQRIDAAPLILLVHITGDAGLLSELTPPIHAFFAAGR